MGTGKRKIAKTAFLFTSSVVVALLLAETAVSLWGPSWVALPLNQPHPSNMYISDEELGCRLRPGFTGRFSKSSFDMTIKIDQDGFRLAAKGATQGESRTILVLGDSFTFGIGVEGDMTFSAILQEMLNQDGSSTTSRVINAGVPGYGTVQEFGLMKREIDRLRPDLVIVCFFPNDLLDNAIHQESEIILNEEGYLVQRWRGDEDNPSPWESSTRGLVDLPFKEFLRERSALYRLCQFQFHRFVERMTLPQNWILDSRIDPLAAYYRLGGDYLYLARQNETVAELWEREYSVLNDMIELAEENEAKFMLLLLPTDNRVYRDRWENEITWLRLSEDIFDGQSVRNALSRYLDGPARPAFFLDLTPHFVKAGEAGERLYYHSDDRHLTARGHREVAEAIYASLLREGLVDG